ncbi:6-pyruvoyl trahydropterin synthase family protein [Bradyrhizobium sp. 5.13L]
MAYLSTKTYGHEVGLSAAFRQWRAKSHCRLLHGYSLSFRFEFEANTLDDKNWVVDFGGLRELRAILEGTFDHKTVVASDDPELEWFREAARRGLADIVVLPAVGCEKFAEHVYRVGSNWLLEKGLAPRCQLVSVEVREHGANSAIYREAGRAAD